MAHIIRVYTLQNGPVLTGSIKKMGDYHSRFNDEFEYYLKIYLFPPILNESKIKP